MTEQARVVPLGALCARCPWRKANQGVLRRIWDALHPSRQPAGKVYTRWALKRFWDRLRSGDGAQVCHAPDSGERTLVECAGAVTLVHRELLKLAMYTEGKVLRREDIDRYQYEHPDGLTDAGIGHYVHERRRPDGTPQIAPPLPQPPEELIRDQGLVGRAGERRVVWLEGTPP